MALEDLLVSGDELDKELVATVLRPLLRIDKETLTVRPQKAWRSTSNQEKIVAFLLARKAMRALSLLDEESAAPAEIIEQTGAPSGSVHPTLKAMYEARPQLVDKDDRSRYWVPAWALDAACELLTGEQKS